MGRRTRGTSTFGLSGGKELEQAGGKWKDLRGSNEEEVKGAGAWIVGEV